MAIADQVKRIIAHHLGVDVCDVTEDVVFRDDLGADSLDAFELLMAFEEAFGIEIPDDVAGQLRCVQDAIAYIEARTTENGGASPRAPAFTKSSQVSRSHHER